MKLGPVAILRLIAEKFIKNEKGGPKIDLPMFSEWQTLMSRVSCLPIIACHQVFNPGPASQEYSFRWPLYPYHPTVEDYITRVAPAYVKVRATPKHGGQGYVCPIDLPAYKAAEEAVAVAFGKRPLAVRRGGSIPIISTFEQVLGIKTVLMGFGLEQNAIHSPNESCTLDFFYKGIESVAVFYKRFN